MSPWVIATGDFTTLGGMDRANHALASYLARHGREVHLVAHRVADDVRSLHGTHVHVVARPFGAHLLGAPLLARAAAWQVRAAGPGARVLVNGGNAVPGAPTWVHYLHASHRGDVAGSMRSRLAASMGRPYYRARERAVLSRAPLVICNSARTAADVREWYGVPGERTRVIYYGVDAGVFSAVTPDARLAARRALGVRDERRVALFVGALGDRRKGFDVLFEAWRTLSRDHAWNVDLVVAGAGGEMDAWVHRAAAAGLADRVTILGFRPDVAALVAATDVLVHPARYEAYGLGVHEALCRGVPAIVTASAGVAERYPAELGGLLLPDPPQAHALVTSLRAWHAQAALWPSRIASFAAALRSRSWDDMAADIVALVEAA